jgi:Protein of unknown function (DUF3592)
MDIGKILNTFWRFAPILLRDAVPFAIAAGAGVRYWIRTRQAASWPSTQGTVQGATASRSEKGRRGWACVLTYSYVASGEYYSGSYAIRARKEHQAEEFATQWKGRSVAVRYSPADHKTSVLLKDDQVGGFGN